MGLIARNLTFFCIAALLLPACSSQDLRVQALEPGSGSLDTIENNLVLMTVHTRPNQADLKLRGLVLRNRATDHVEIFSFFNNFILGSKVVEYSVEGNGALQDILMDLPAGEYEVTDLDFMFRYQEASPPAMSGLISSPLIFKVADSTSTYVGRLTIDIEKITLNNLFGSREFTFPLQKDVTMYSTFENAEGELRFMVSDTLTADRARIAATYPALSSVRFVTSLIRNE